LEPMQAAYEAGVAAFEAGECDAARSSLLEAEELGSDHAALFWAEHTDSLDFDGCLADRSNDIRALDRYEIACKAGLDGVQEKVALLETELTRRRDDEGDPIAGQVLTLKMPAIKEACKG